MFRWREVKAVSRGSIAEWAILALAFVFFGENKNLNQWFYIGFALIAAALAIHVLLILKEERNKKQETKKARNN